MSLTSYCDENHLYIATEYTSPLLIDSFNQKHGTMPRITKANGSWIRAIIERNRAPYTKDIIFIPFIKERGSLFQIYLLCQRALQKMKARFDLNGLPSFFKHADVHLTYANKPLSSTIIAPLLETNGGAVRKYRVIRIHNGDIGNEIVHYSETWYTEAMWQEYDNSLPGPPRLS